jgi:hypothetical protein
MRETDLERMRLSMRPAGGGAFRLWQEYNVGVNLSALVGGLIVVIAALLVVRRGGVRR